MEQVLGHAQEEKRRSRGKGLQRFPQEGTADAVHGFGRIGDPATGAQAWQTKIGQALGPLDDDETAPDVTSLTYQTASSYFTLQEGDYDIYFADAGTSTIVIGPATFHLSNGDVTSLVLLDDGNGNLELMPVMDAAE